MSEVKVYFAKLFNFQNEDEDRFRVVLKSDFDAQAAELAVALKSNGALSDTVVSLKAEIAELKRKGNGNDCS